MIALDHLPTLNAFLNSISVIFLCLGLFFIKKKNINAHKFCMGTAFVASTLFLISYVTYHAHVGSKHFTGEGLIRSVYFSILISHTILAAAIVPLILVTC